ncbi:MCP four helix bundle domain-containing protein [Bradyrhizobium tropiciagri]|uniref:methyl-accepting chemotaxis protein n=1 Tax=Bradyrhizobium tropiciagri TaxID=312253 RepID=UPI001BAC8232|nr:methyl-accepting chemotaxis protein [Bradyrhizobium tropiciagri]MBR0899170.1 MCP four helix bundle domain-containing protein [Bradyrhizobium tropiciagri]
MLANLSVRARLIAVIVMLLITLAGTGLFAVTRMQTMNEYTINISTKWLPSVRVLGEIRVLVNRYRVNIRQFVLDTDPQKKATDEKALEAIAQAIAEKIKSYQPLVTSQEERELADAFMEAWTDYVTQIREVMDINRKDNDTAKARDFITAKAPVGAKLETPLQKNIDLNNKGADVATRKAADNYALTLKLISAILLTSMILGICAGIYLLRTITRGINSVVTPMRVLAAGDLTVAVPCINPKTEIGQMASALQVFKDALVAKKAVDEAAAADANAKITRGQRVDAVTSQFESMIGELVSSLSSSATELEAAANTLTTSAQSTGRISGDAAGASQEVSTNVQSVAGATEKITSSVNEIGRQVQQASRVASDAVRQAEKTNASITELSQSSARIGDVVRLITAIAEQTNLLALNATIEAARAGNAGRGFAIVASEVKALAAQTSKATDEIATQIASMQSATETSVGAIREISATINVISEISSAIATAVEEQSAATQEIARNVITAARGSSAVASNIDDVSRGASETGSASSQVLASARMLSNQSERLKSEVEKFLATVRAA